MKAFVDPDLCIGCTQCTGICPEVFQMTGILAVAVPGELPPDTRTHRRGSRTGLPGECHHYLGVTPSPAFPTWEGIFVFSAKIPRWPPFCVIL